MRTHAYWLLPIRGIKQQMEETNKPHSSLDISLLQDVDYLFLEEAKELKNQLGSLKSKGKMGTNMSSLTVTYHYPISRLDDILLYYKILDGYDMHLKRDVDILKN